MADTKISALPAALTMANADVLPIVRAGTTQKVTKAELLTAAATENISQKASAGGFTELRDVADTAHVRVSDAGLCHVHGATGIDLQVAANTVLQIGLSGNFLFRPGGGGGVPLDLLTPGGLIFKIDDTANLITLTCPGGVVVTYKLALPAVTGDWLTTVPADMNAAINRLASWLASVSGQAIP